MCLKLILKDKHLENIKHNETWTVHLTHQQQKMHGCVLSTVATDALVLKHQTISIHWSNAD